ncbi:MAG: DMT family transporter [Dehalococcoidia bacterium]
MPGEGKALLAAALWAIAGIVFAAQIRRVSPLALNFIRCLAATAFVCLLIPFTGASGEIRSASAATIVTMVATGVLSTAFGDSLFFFALPALGASLAVPVSSSVYPLLTLFIAAVALGEKITVTIVFGSLLVVLGIFLLLSQTRPAVVAAPVDERRRNAFDKRVAVLLLIAAAAFYTTSTVWLRVGTGNLGPTSAGVLRTGAAGVFLLSTLRPLEGSPRFDFRSAAWVAVAGVIGLGLGSLFYIAAVEEAGAGKTAVLTSTMPLFNLPLAVLFLKERVTPRIILGTITCVAGISLII